MDTLGISSGEPALPGAGSPDLDASGSGAGLSGSGGGDLAEGISGADRPDGAPS
jgi:hypothetical protein